MKVVEIRPVFKRLDNTSKDNYRPISTLSNFAKLFESIIYSQLNDWKENKFSKYLNRFRKNHNTQNSLLRMIETWKAKLKNRSKVGVIIMDLSKAFDSLNHDLLLAKLEAYGLDNKAVSFMKSYLTNRLQHCKINNSFSEWTNICWGPRRIYIRLASFQYIYQWHLLISSRMWPSKLCWWQCYIYFKQTRFLIVDSPSHEFAILSRWFYNNFMVLNPEVWCINASSKMHDYWPNIFLLY